MECDPQFYEFQIFMKRYIGKKDLSINYIIFAEKDLSIIHNFNFICRNIKLFLELSCDKRQTQLNKLQTHTKLRKGSLILASEIAFVQKFYARNWKGLRRCRTKLLSLELFLVLIYLEYIRMLYRVRDCIISVVNLQC